jgi:hypothetical protein
MKQFGKLHLMQLTTFQPDRNTNPEGQKTIVKVIYDNMLFCSSKDEDPSKE